MEGSAAGKLGTGYMMEVLSKLEIAKWDLDQMAGDIYLSMLESVEATQP